MFDAFSDITQYFRENTKLFFNYISCEAWHVRMTTDEKF
jgi:hypothetical protein